MKKNITIPTPLWARVCQLADTRHVTKSDIVREAINAWTLAGKTYRGYLNFERMLGRKASRYTLHLDDAVYTRLRRSAPTVDCVIRDVLHWYMNRECSRGVSWFEEGE